MVIKTKARGRTINKEQNQKASSFKISNIYTILNFILYTDQYK